MWALECIVALQENHIMKHILEFILCLAIFAGWGVMLALGV
jgi:hypothetical protein